MKTIGILGGMGPQATLDFEERIHKISQHVIPQKLSTGYPPMVSYYLRSVPMQMKNGVFVEPLVPEKGLLEAAKTMGRISDFLVIVSNTPHFFQKEIEKASGKSVLSMVDVTIDDVKKRKLRKVGILAVGLTLKYGLYQKPLDKAGVAYETIPSDLAHRLDEAVFNFVEGKASKQHVRVAQEAISFLREKDVDSIILGSTEVPLILERGVDAKDILNPAALLAEAAVERALK